ncbi:MAG: hypothetical protein QE265_09475 [Rhodoferax sp.]|nr:hypothetical protein [Rhodoferax sp.]
MTPTQITNAISTISTVFSSVLGPGSGLQASLAGMVASKLYEAKALSAVLSRLSAAGYSFAVVNGTVCLKASPGPINNSYAHIQVTLNGKHVANIWTDVEFVGLSSYKLAGLTAPSARGEYHELDILVCDPSATIRPRSDQVFIGVEAKHWRDIPKKLLREILGVRRELSLRRGSGGAPKVTAPSFQNLGCSDPASHLIFAFSTPYLPGTGPLTEWKVPAEQFDIELLHIPV